MRLENKVAVVTGAGSGFGAGIARRFAAEGARVVLADIDDAAGRGVADAIARDGGEALCVHADVTLRAEVKAMIEAACAAYGRLDILINNAGYSHRRQPLIDVGEADFDRVYTVNVKALYLAALEVVPLFRGQGAGCIINTSSTAGLRPRPGLIPKVLDNDP